MAQGNRIFWLCTNRDCGSRSDSSADTGGAEQRICGCGSVMTRKPVVRVFTYLDFLYEGDSLVSQTTSSSEQWPCLR